MFQYLLGIVKIYTVQVYNNNSWVVETPSPYRETVLCPFFIKGNCRSILLNCQTICSWEHALSTANMAIMIAPKSLFKPTFSFFCPVMLAANHQRIEWNYSGLYWLYLHSLMVSFLSFVQPILFSVLSNINLAFILAGSSLNITSRALHYITQFSALHYAL